MADSKKIAVIIRDRQDEALRMSVGLTLEGDEITVINLGDPIDHHGDNNLNVETLGDLDCGRISVNEADEGFEHMTMQNIPQKLLEFDHVVPY
ncbi:MAG: hypothetical protein M0Z32_08720 [Actinomycetota bacterium]|jgi:hypothetical protein|nr:hypothetical protein [Actinomycetota bacterium]MDA8167809.1 hypothetical protein [Actinomycetota bacterium]